MSAITLLHAERLARGWGRSKVASLMEEAARTRGDRPLATHESLIRMLARYERKGMLPAEPYRSLLCEVYGKPSAAFGWLDSDAEQLARADLTPTALKVTIAHAERALSHQLATLEAAEAHLADLRTMVGALTQQLGTVKERSTGQLVTVHE